MACCFSVVAGLISRLPATIQILIPFSITPFALPDLIPLRNLFLQYLSVIKYDRTNRPHRDQPAGIHSACGI